MDSRHVVAFCAVVIFLWSASGPRAQQLNNQQVENDMTDSSSLGSTNFFYQLQQYPRDCKEVQHQCSTNNLSGVYIIKPDGYYEPFEVYCNNSQDSRGWTVVLRRLKGDVNFGRNWKDYEIGFGFLSHEFWLGNQKLSYLTNQNKYELRLDMTNSEGISFFVTYDNFRISDQFSNYSLVSLGKSSGNAGTFTTCEKNTGIGNCTCQKTCDDPQNCVNICSDLETCVCPDGYYLKEGRCVPPEECNCYAFEKFILEGGFYANSDCTKIAFCNNGQLSWNDSYLCSSNAVCEERHDLRKCYCHSGFIGEGQTCARASDCLDIYNAGETNNGVYLIKPSSWPGSPFEVYCNMTDGGGWTVFQRREDGSVDFYRSWISYKEGFGAVNHEFWLGNDKLYHLTNQKRYTIRIDLVNRYGTPYYGKYDFFRISNETELYQLTEVGAYSGNADEGRPGYPVGYSLSFHNGHPFSTYDRDNDQSGYYNWPENARGAWWYYGNYWSNLNGDYNAQLNSVRSITWHYLPGSDRNIKYTEMKVRPT